MDELADLAGYALSSFGLDDDDAPAPVSVDETVRDGAPDANMDIEAAWFSSSFAPSPTPNSLARRQDSGRSDYLPMSEKAFDADDGELGVIGAPCAEESPSRRMHVHAGDFDAFDRTGISSSAKASPVKLPWTVSPLRTPRARTEAAGPSGSSPLPTLLAGPTMDTIVLSSDDEVEMSAPARASKGRGRGKARPAKAKAAAASSSPKAAKPKAAPRRRADHHKRPWEDEAKERRRLELGIEPPPRTAKDVRKEKRAGRRQQMKEAREALKDGRDSFEETGVVPMTGKRKRSARAASSDSWGSSDELPDPSDLGKEMSRKRRSTSGNSLDKADNDRDKYRPSQFMDPIVEFIQQGVPLPRPSQASLSPTATPGAPRSAKASPEKEAISPLLPYFDWASEKLKRRRQEAEDREQKAAKTQAASRCKENTNPNPIVEFVDLDSDEETPVAPSPPNLAKRLDGSYQRTLVLADRRIPDSVLGFKPSSTKAKRWITLDPKKRTVLVEVEGVVVAVEVDSPVEQNGVWEEIIYGENGEPMLESKVLGILSSPGEAVQEGLSDLAESLEIPEQELYDEADGSDDEDAIFAPTGRARDDASEGEEDARDADAMANNPRELSNLLLEVAVFLTTAEEASRVLNPAEMELWTLIRDASVHSRAVLGGLFLRKQRPMRVPILLESLAARGIPVPDAVLEAYDAQLLELGLYSVHKSESLGRLLEHLRVPELKAMARGTKMGTGAKKKEDYIAHLCKMAANQKHLIKGTDGNIRLSLGRRERSGPYWEEAKSLIGLLVSIPGPVFAAMHTGLSVFFRPSPFAYAASLADPKHSPLKFAHMAVTQVKGFAMPPGRVTPGARSEDWWREGREGFDAWAEASKVAFDIGKLVEQRTEEAYAEAVELLSVEVLAEWRAEVKRVGDTEPDDWREAWRRGCTEKGAVLTELVTLLAALHASLGDAESQCEVLQELLEQGAFGHSHRGRWFNDLTRVLQGNKRRLPEHAYEWVRAALDEEREGIWASRGGRRRELLKRAALLEVQLDVPIEDALVDHEAGFFEAPKRIINSGVNYFGNGEWEGGVSVEQVAMDWFSDHGNWVGVHAENSVIGLIFCLLALDVLFPPGAEDSPVDALPHQYGRHPADLFSVPGPLFFQNRGHLVAPWIEQIRATGVELVIARDRMLRERHCMPVGIGAWKRVPQECVVGVCRALGNERLAKLCEAIVETGWRSRCGGFPDLTLWKYDHVKDKYHVLFSEVKGPGDQLSETQQVWIETLLRIGCDAEVSHVLAKNDVDGNYC